MAVELANADNARNPGNPRMRRGMGVRGRISLPLLIPVLGLLFLSGLLLTQKLAVVAAMQRVEAVSELVTDTSALVHEIQRERGLSGGFLASKGTEQADDLLAQRTRTDMRRAAFDARLRQIDIGHSVPASGAPGGTLAAVRDGLAKLGEIRLRISQLAATTADSFAFFTAVNASLFDVVGETAADVEAPDVARSVAAYLSFLQAKELAGQERAVGNAGFAAGRFDAPQLRRLIMLGDQQELYFRIIAAAATPAQTDFMHQTITGEAADAVVRLRQTAAEGGLEGHLGGVTGIDWFNAATARIERLKQVEDRMSGDLKLLAGRIRGAAEMALYKTLGAVLALLGLTAAVGILTIRSIVRPLAASIRTMQRLATGEVDLLINGTDRHDELGSMAKAIEVFRDQAVENRRLTAAQEAERVRAEAEKRAALRDMADRIETETAKALVEVGDCTIAMTATADSMTGSATRTGASAQSAASAAAQTLSNAQTVAAAAEQLSASIREISSQMSLSTAVAGRAVAAGDETRATIKQLDGKVAEIGTVADMIREIAAKTNLLALNATIEAARAGAAGKGFAVVASEVKALAMQTARSTEEISRHLAEVRAATTASVDAVGRIGETIVEIEDIASSIAAAVEQQGAATAEIARNVAQTAQAADEMTARISEVSSEAEETGRQASQVRSSAAGLATAVGELKHTVMRVVRTSTSEVDRRTTRRREINLNCRLTLAGRDVCNGRVVDLSEQGARIADAPHLSAGTRGTLDVDGIDARLAFTVRHQYSDALGLVFDADVAAATAIALALKSAEGAPAHSPSDLKPYGLGSGVAA